MDFDKLIKVGDFATIQTESLKENALSPGDTVYVAGSRALPESEDDPYLQRIYFICSKVEDGEVETGKFILLNGNNIEKVDEETQEALEENFKEQFDEEQTG